MSIRRAFTLIELLVVMVIISVLIGILMPALASARARGRLTQCATNLRQVGMGFRSYLQDNSDIFPYASYMPSISPAPLPLQQGPIFISEVLAPHVSETDKVFACPQDLTGADRDPPNSMSYFQSEKSSYQYRTGDTLPEATTGEGRGRPGLCGRSMAELVKLIYQRRERTLNENQIWIMSDFGNFHARAGAPGSRRYLYLDGRVEDYDF